MLVVTPLMHPKGKTLLISINNRPRTSARGKKVTFSAYELNAQLAGWSGAVAWETGGSQRRLRLHTIDNRRKKIVSLFSVVFVVSVTSSRLPNLYVCCFCEEELASFSNMKSHKYLHLKRVMAMHSYTQ